MIKLILYFCSHFWADNFKLWRTTKIFMLAVQHFEPYFQPWQTPVHPNNCGKGSSPVFTPPKEHLLVCFLPPSLFKQYGYLWLVYQSLYPVNEPTPAHLHLGFCLHVQQSRSAVIFKITHPFASKIPCRRCAAALFIADEAEQGQRKPAISSLDRRFNCVARGS